MQLAVLSPPTFRGALIDVSANTDFGLGLNQRIQFREYPRDSLLSSSKWVFGIRHWHSQLGSLLTYETETIGGVVLYLRGWRA